VSDGLFACLSVSLFVPQQLIYSNRLIIHGATPDVVSVHFGLPVRGSTHPCRRLSPWRGGVTVASVHLWLFVCVRLYYKLHMKTAWAINTKSVRVHGGAWACTDLRSEVKLYHFSVSECEMLVCLSTRLHCTYLNCVHKLQLKSGQTSSFTFDCQYGIGSGNSHVTKMAAASPKTPSSGAPESGRHLGHVTISTSGFISALIFYYCQSNAHNFKPPDQTSTIFTYTSSPFCPLKHFDY